MSEQPTSSSETYWFFNNTEKDVRYNKHFIIVTGNTVSCSACKTDLPISVIKTESSKKEFSLFLHHITEEGHLQNVLNYIVSRLPPSIQDVKNQFKIIRNSLSCQFCNTVLHSIVDIEKTIVGLEIHACGKKHQQKLQTARVLAGTQQKNVETVIVDYTQDQSKASTSVTSSSNVLCSVCESQIEIFNQDLLLSQDLHNQSEQHSNACKRKLRQIFAKYEEGNQKSLVVELFHIYPKFFDQLQYCDLFRDIVHYLLCSVCGKPISKNVPSVNNEIYNHISTSEVCESKYLSKIFGEFLSKNNFIAEARATEKKEKNKVNSDRISELFQCLPPHLKSNEFVISSVGNSLYCTICSCYINTCTDKSQTLRNLKVHLETVHFENLLNKVFDQMPEKFQINKQFMFYKDNFIMCNLCDTGMTYSPVKLKETATNMKEHLKGRQHQNILEKVLTTAKPNKPPVNTNPLPGTADTFKGNIDKLIGSLLPHKAEIASLLKKNKRFLRVQHMDFVCTLCQKKVGDVQNIKQACNTIVLHFKCKKHITLMNNTSQNISLWKLVYDCYAPELIKSNERYIQKVGNKFRCTLCSLDINDQKENVMEKILKHVKSEQHILVNVYANLSLK